MRVCVFAWTQRLIKDNGEAASVFFSSVHEHAPASAVCRLIVLLYRCLVRVVNKKQGVVAADDDAGQF